MTQLFVVNDGQEIVETNYFKSEHAARGFFYISINAGCLRLLVPDVQIHAITEMATAKEVIVSRGPWPDQGKSDGLELLFEDNSDTPYALHMLPDQCDRIPGNADTGKKRLFTAWSSAGKQLELPMYIRMVKRIPWMKSHTGKR